MPSRSGSPLRNKSFLHFSASFMREKRLILHIPTSSKDNNPYKLFLLPKRVYGSEGFDCIYEASSFKYAIAYAFIHVCMYICMLCILF